MGITKFDNFVLYVEDEDIIRKQIGAILKKFFHNILIARDGVDALNQFNMYHNDKQSIDLIITDIDMPLMNGFELLRETRKINPDLHSIITSGMSFGTFLDDINSIDILNDYLTKPIDIQKLMDAIKKAIPRILKRKEYKNQYNITQQYKNALDNSAIVSKTDHKGKITYANDAFCTISGYRLDELVGKNHNMVRHPDVSNEIFKELWDTIKNKKIFKHPSLANKAKDGTTYYVNTTIIPILDHDNNISEFISVRFDTTTLEKSILDERKAKESQAIFLANMSHEIRTPLNGVMGFTHLLQDANLPKKESEYIDIIDSSASQLLHTIDEILDISKIETGKMTIENILFNPHKEFEFIKKLFEAKAKEKNIALIYNSISKSSNDINLKGDITKLKQVLSNLLNNAIKFTPNNGKVIFNIQLIEQTDKTIELEFSIVDNGIGIDISKQKDIFKPFIQENQSTTREYGGTGLGLAISKDILSLMNSEMKLLSAKDSGSKFYFNMKFEYEYEKLQNTDVPKDTDDTTTSYNGHILVAEDVEINQKLINAILTKKGFQVTFANNGLEVVEIFNKYQNKFCLVFLDINMPVMDGLEALIQINKTNSTLNIPIVALTANAIAGDREKFLNHGFNNYLAKPINNDELSNILHQYLSSQDQIVVEKKSIHVENDFISKNAAQLELPEEFYIELLSEFLGGIEKEIALLQQYTKENEKENFLSLAHKLKGVSGNIRLNSLYEIFKHIETASEDEDFDKIFEEINSIVKALNQLV